MRYKNKGYTNIFVFNYLLRPATHYIYEMGKKDPTLFETDRVPFYIPQDRKNGVGPGTYFNEKHVTKDYGR